MRFADVSKRSARADDEEQSANGGGGCSRRLYTWISIDAAKNGARVMMINQQWFRYESSSACNGFVFVQLQASKRASERAAGGRAAFARSRLGVCIVGRLRGANIFARRLQPTSEQSDDHQVAAAGSKCLALLASRSLPPSPSSPLHRERQ